MKQFLSVGEAAAMLGVAVSTLRRWHSSKKLIPQCRSIGGHRRYSVSQVLAITHPDQIKQNRINVGYARVSSHDQKKDLETQKQRLADYGERFDTFDVIDDLGSGLNYRKKGLRRLIQRVCQSKIDKLVLIHKDRLLRFGSEIIFQLCAYFGTEVVILEEVNETFENRLCHDVIELMTVFSARLYGKRSHRNRKSLKSSAIVGRLINIAIVV